jgi:signal transduction histidine kinase
MATTLKEAFSVNRFSFWTGALLSSLVGSMLYTITAGSIETDARQRFVNHARYAQSVISVRIKSYTDLMRATGSMVQGSDILTHRRFHDYVRGLHLDKNFPAVDSINLAVHVTDAQRADFIGELDAAMRPLLGAPLTLSPPGRRPDYLIVSYLEPHLAGHFGIDLMANPYFSDILDLARDTGRMSASGTPIPVLSTPNDKHLGMRMPLYRPHAPIATVAQRRAAYAGSLGVAFGLPKLVHGVLDDVPIAHMRMTLYDTGAGVDSRGRKEMPKPHAMFDSIGSAADPAPALAGGDGVFTITLPLDFIGRPWQTVYSVSKTALYTGFDAWYPKLMMVFGFVASMLIYALLHTLTSSRRAALVLAQDMTRELRASQDKLELAHQKLRRLADHAYQVKEHERKRIAREIHDDLGQNLLALRIETELLAARTRGRHTHLHRRARATLAHIDATIRSVRQIINDLRPTVLDLGLSAAVEWQVTQFQRRTGIACDIVDGHGEISVSDHCATAFFRILQESLNNIVRHANATRVTVELRLDGGWLTLTVRDNGCGLAPGGRNKYGSFGLVGIEERIVILGGTCAVYSEPGGGTTVTVSAPATSAQAGALDAAAAHAAGSALI